MKNLAGVLTTQAVYHEAHAKGPGLYARMKVFADHAQIVEEKAAHVGMSIRASGIAEARTMREGVPVLKELTSAESVDVVTRAGAGGMILTESARAAEKEEVTMTEEAIQKLVESAVTKATDPLRERALRGDAVVEANRILKPLALREAGKQMALDNVIAKGLPRKDGELDVKVFEDLLMAEAKRVAEVIGGGGVHGRGSGIGLVEKPKTDEERLAEAKRNADLAKLDEDEAISIYESIGLDKTVAKFAAKGRAA